MSSITPAPQTAPTLDLEGECPRHLGCPGQAQAGGSSVSPGVVCQGAPAPSRLLQELLVGRTGDNPSPAAKDHGLPQRTKTGRKCHRSTAFHQILL